MKRRTEYGFDPNRPPMSDVLIIEPRNSNNVMVYCPPNGGENPWIETFDNFDDALAVASREAKKRGQAAVLHTQDALDLWMEGLQSLESA